MCFLRLLLFSKPIIGTFVNGSIRLFTGHVMDKQKMQFCEKFFNILENWIKSKIKLFRVALLYYFLYPPESLFKKLLKFVFEPLVHCNSFLITSFQDSLHLLLKELGSEQIYYDEELGCMEFLFCNDMGDIKKCRHIDSCLQDLHINLQ